MLKTLRNWWFWLRYGLTEDEIDKAIERMRQRR